MASGYKAFKGLNTSSTREIVGNAHKGAPVENRTNQTAYVRWVMDCMDSGIKLDKRSTEKKAGELGITRQAEVKELTELAIVNQARNYAHVPGWSNRLKYDSIVDLYKSQVNLSHRTSTSVILQQYSTPAPLAFLMGVFCQLNTPNVWAFEPSAGNGLLTIAGDPARCVVNEIDELRRQNLETQHYYLVTGADASKLFGLSKWGQFYEHFKADAVLTNPPFGKLESPKQVGPASIDTLEHWMVINALDNHLKDTHARYREYFREKIETDVAEYQESAKYKKLPDGDKPRALHLATREIESGYEKIRSEKLSSFNANNEHVRSAVGFFHVGRQVKLLGANGVKIPGIVVGFSVDRKKKYPLDPKNVDLLIAVASSQKMLTLSLSDAEDRTTLYAIRGASDLGAGMDWMADRQRILAWWGMAIKQGLSDRTNRYVVTGNLLQAYKHPLLDKSGGKIITFTTDDNRQRRGIMMPDEFSPNPQPTAAGGMTPPVLVDVPIIKAEKIIASLPVDKLVSTATNVVIVRHSINHYQIISPMARHKDLYTDPMLLPLLTGHDGFNSVSTNMVAEFNQDKLSDVLTVLQVNHGMTVKLTSEQIKYLTDEIEPDQGDDYVPQPPAPPARPEPPVSPVESDADFALLQLQLELEAEALLLLAEAL